jgi:hypothetical protein
MIDDNIPVPPRKYPQARTGARTEGGRIGRQLQTGQSHFFTEQSAFNTARTAVYESGGKTRTEKREENGVRGWRLWRVG